MSSEDPAYPAINLRTPAKQLLLAKTTSLAASWFRADLGSALPVAAIDLRNVNFTAFSIEASNDGIAWSLVWIGAAGAIGQSIWTRRYQGLMRFSTASYRYWRVIPSSPIAGATQYQCGGLGVLLAAEEFSQNFERIAYEPFQRRTVIEETGEMNEEGAVGVRIAFGKERWHRNTGNALAYLRLMASGSVGPMLLAENADATLLSQTESYLCRLVSHSPFDVGFRRVSASFLFEELF
jgi:hypothetical protein